MQDLTPSMHARKIVDAHGGRMFVESEPGHGSVFGFTLPLDRLGAASVPSGTPIPKEQI